MKKTYTILALAVVCCFAAPNFVTAAAAHSKATEAFVATGDDDARAEEVAKAAKADWDKLTAKEKRMKRHELKRAVKDAKANGADVSTLLLVIIAILLPPLAMALYDGISTRFWISLLLTLLFYLPGLIYTLVVILGGK